MLDMDIINAAMVRQNSDPEAAAARRAANEAIAKKTELNQEDFLTLMITQLKNQDPIKPMDPAQYVGQLAQFSSVSGLAEMNEQIGSLTGSLRGNQVLDGAGLIGRTVIAPGNDIYLPEAVEGEVRGPQGLINVPAGRLRRAARGQGFERRAGEDAGARQPAAARRPSPGTAPPTAVRQRRPAPTASKSSPAWASKTFL